MKKKKKYINGYMEKGVLVNGLMFGEEVLEELFSLKERKGEHGENYRVILSDRTGDVLAQTPIAFAKKAGLYDMPEGTVIEVSGVLLNDGMDRMLVLRENISICTEYFPREVIGGISPEVAAQCKKEIRELFALIKHPGYRALVEACLTDDVLETMERMPATLKAYGRYNGACLVATNAVSHMVLTSMTAYTKRGNRISTTKPSWYALTTASLLFLYGNLEFLTPLPPYKRTTQGVMMGYVALLQKMIDGVIRDNDIMLSETDYATLISILKVALEEKTGLRAVSKDGSILRHIITLYRDCDCFDWDIANHEVEESEENEEGYYYSHDMKAYVVPSSENI